ncbi:MAG TPA: PPC domain-containing protein, partial [Isosphaeraceae bacterium]
MEVTLTGARLGDAQEILYYQPGIATVALTKVDDNNVKAKLKIAPDAPLGLHDVRVRTATGVSELRTFSVGALAEVAEKEPNSDFAAPQPIALNSTVTGVADNEDVDYYRIEARKGQRISAEVEGIRLGLFLFDPYVAIMDARRFELASSDDAALVWQDGVASVLAPEDGAYIIQVRESAYAGNGNCLYRLHVGTFPRPEATVPAGGKLGENVAVTWIGDVAGDTSTQVSLPAAPDRNFGLVARDEDGVAPYPNAFRLSPFGNAVEAEPNDDHATATPFAAPLALNGVIVRPGDVDHFAFPAKTGQVYDVRVLARALRSPLDSVLYIAKKGGGALAGNDDNAAPDSYLRFTAPEDADYVVSIQDHLKQGGPDFFYRIEVSPVAPKLALSVANETMARGIGPSAVAVPRGNRQAILVTAARNDFGGELILGASGLPSGVAMQADAMAASVGTFPVVFEAAADAPVAGTLGTITGRHADPNVPVPSEFSQTSELVLGQNNTAFWARTVDRLAVAVTEEAPYSIEVVEPKVPLVRGGTMNLKVVAKRKEGFQAPIAVSLPWNPPGVGSAGGVSIPEGQNEAVIPLNANGGAELRTWKVVVNGSASGPSGPLTVSSPLTRLTVAEPFLSFAFQAAAVEQGQETDLAIAVTKARDFPGAAQVTLFGLPNKV